MLGTLTYAPECGENGVLFVGDVAVTPMPDANQLAQIAVCTAQTAQAVSGLDPNEQSIEELKDKIYELIPKAEPDKTDRNYQKNVVPKLDMAKSDFLVAIDDAVAKYGTQRVAEALSKNRYMQRIGDMENKYAYQIVGEITDGDTGLIALLDASIDNALSDL